MTPPCAAYALAPSSVLSWAGIFALASLLAGEGKGMPHERLSDREFEVLKMLASGRTVSQVAQDLSLSVKTVSTHRMRILKKMNMKTNAELTHYAVRNGLVQ